MGGHIDLKKLVIITEPTSIRIDLPTKINESPEYDTKFIVSRNKSLTKYKIKTRD